MIRLIGKESNNIFLKYIFVSALFYLGFSGPIFSERGAKRISLSVILRTEHCIFMQLGRYLNDL